MTDKKTSSAAKQNIDLSVLNKKFRPEDIDWVIINAFDYSTRNGVEIKAYAQPYIKKEVAEKTADEAFGVDNWENDFKILTSDGYIKYWIRYRASSGSEWIYKRAAGSISSEGSGFQGGEFETAESYAEKRCWSKVGIGRYLKMIPAIEVEISRKWQQGWNKYSFKSKVDKGDYTSFYWKTPQLPAEALPDGYTYDEPGPTPDKAPPKPQPTQKRKEATKRDWKIMLAYYNNIPPADQQTWQPYLFTETVDEQTGEVAKLDPKRISHDAATKYIESMEKGYGPLNSNGVPEDIAEPPQTELEKDIRQDERARKGVTQKQVEEAFDARPETKKK